MLHRILVLCLLAVAVSQAKLYKGPRLPLALQVDPKFRNHVDERIIGGDEVKPNSIPFQVSFQTKDGNHFCGAILKDASTIITAAHCCDSQSASSVKIVAGEHNLRELDGTEQERMVKNIIIHEDYDSILLTFDICLLKLESPLDLNNVISGVTLPKADADFPTGTPSEVSGWGVPNVGGSLTEVLMAASLKIDSDAGCTSGYGDSYIPQHHICASDIDKDSCQGDSGGPLTCGKTRVLCGIVSWGYGCAQAGYPGVYSRITEYIDWMAANA